MVFKTVFLSAMDEQAILGNISSEIMVSPEGVCQCECSVGHRKIVMTYN